MTNLSSFLPIDRLDALARGRAFDDRVTGAALLADVSGFTVLAAALAGTLGPQRGAEELTRHLNAVYGALIGEVDRYGGSVIGFSGDAITCWFDAGRAGSADAIAEASRRAATCALAMQGAMKGFARIEVAGVATVSLAAKVAVAGGRARRFRVGDRAIQYLDALAGATLDRLAAAEQGAKREEVVVNGETAAAIADAIVVRERRVIADATGARDAAVLERMARPAEPIPWPAIPAGAVAEEELRPWVLPAVRERLAAGRGDLLAELRPAIAVFVQFGGIDYDSDEHAGAKLDAYVQWVQRVLGRYEGTLMDLTIGDKGSYLYAAFGAPTAHEDDAERALRAAIELRSAPAELSFLSPLRIGVSGGRTRAGTIGGPTRRAYTVTGNDVNVAARLMERAALGETLVSEHVMEATRGAFVGRALGAVGLRGKSDAVRVVALERVRESRAARGERRAGDGAAATPMVGRERELALIVEKMERAARGSGQLVAITAEAGIGKSRLLAEVTREARKRGFAVHAGGAQSFGRVTTYLAWHGVWGSLLEFDAGAGVTAEEREEALGAALGRVDAALLPRLPLLGAAVGIAIADNDLTKQFEAKLRKDSLEALLTTCLRARAAEGPVVIAIEDAHWMDALSIDLLESIGRAVAGMKVLLVVTSRTEEGEGKATGRLAPLPHFAEARLRELGREDSAAMITRLARARLGSEAAVPERFVELVQGRAEGNPFLAEELVGYLFDRGITPERATSGEAIELPSNVAGAILGRVDRLTTTQQTTLKVASVIGRTFRFEWLWGVYPEVGIAERVREQLEDLERRELVTAEGERDGGEYAFKHSLIQEVIYESLPFETRERLHEALASWLERRGEGSVDLLAFHYGRAGNVGKKRESRKAGDAAAARYANEAAAGYYEKLVEVVEEGGKAEALLSLGMAKAGVSKWEEAERAYLMALELVEGGDLRGRLSLALSMTYTKRTRYDEALRRLTEAHGEFAIIGDRGGATNVLIEGANLFMLQGKLEECESRLHEALRIEGPEGDRRRIARAYHVLGNVAGTKLDVTSAQRWFSQSLEIHRKVGDKQGIAALTANLALMAWAEGRLDEAQPPLDESLSICHELGMRWSTSRTTEVLGLIRAAHGDFRGARAHYRRALSVARDLGAIREIAELLIAMTGTWRADGESGGRLYALRLGATGSALFERLGIPIPPLVKSTCDLSVAEIRESIGDVLADKIWAEGRAMGWAEGVDYALEDVVE